jgi:RNA polymerase sigma-70 factor, ECF subfamily
MTALRATDARLDGAAIPDDRELTLAFQRGETEAYRLIFERYSPRVTSVCRRMLGRCDEVEEVSQETFLRVFQALPRFNGRYQLGAWITRIATNVCLDHIRSRSRKPSDATPDEILELEGDDFERSDPAEISVRRAEGRRIRKVLESLPPLHRAAIVLRDFEGLSYCEVADALDLTEIQVKALLHRARKGFKRSWADHGLLGSLIPVRLWQRIKGFDSTVRETATQASIQTGQIANSCSAVLQQCGQIVGERVAPVVATVLMATAAVAPAPPVMAAAPVNDRVAHEDSSGRSSAEQVRASVVRQRGSDVPPEGPPVEPDPGPAPPATEPSPSPTEGSGTAPPEGPSDPEPTEEPLPSAPPFMPVLGWSTSEPMGGNLPASHEATVLCDSLHVSQRLETVIAYGSSSYPALLVLDLGSTVSLDLTVYKDGRQVRYVGGGPMISNSRDGDTFSLQYSGSYGSGGNAASLAGLPASGRFDAALTLDCATLSVVTESVVLATQ